MKTSQLILIRHGQSEWNKKNLFTGWTDVQLSEKGREEAFRAGQELKKRQIQLDRIFSSVLKRAIQTMEIILKQMNLMDIPIVKAWQLNERHYGALQGQNRQAVIEKYGAKQVHQWRRSFETAPPPLKKEPEFKKTELYKGLEKIPNGESLKDTQQRVLPFWEKNIYPHIQTGQSILISAHGNSLRALIKKLKCISNDEIASLEIKTGRPIIYKLDRQANILSQEILSF